MPKQKLRLNLNTKYKTIILLFFICISIIGSYQYEIKKSRTTHLFFTESYKPYIKVPLNDHQHPFIIDTGAAYHSILDDEIASTLAKKEYFSTVELFDMDKTQHEIPEFVTEKIQFFNIKFEKFYFLRPSSSFFANNHYTNAPQKELNVDFSNETSRSYLGHQLLGLMGLSIDFKKNIFKLYRPNLIPLYDFPFGFFTFEKKIPLNYTFSIGPVCEVQTESGKLKFLIDTGCPFSVIHPDKAPLVDDGTIWFVFNEFKLDESRNFGPVNMHIEPKVPLDRIDGILGLDFFQNKQVFFNIPQRYFCLKK